MDSGNPIKTPQLEAWIKELKETFDMQLRQLNQLVVKTKEISSARRAEIMDGLEGVRKTFFESTVTNLKLATRLEMAEKEHSNLDELTEAVEKSIKKAEVTSYAKVTASEPSVPVKLPYGKKPTNIYSVLVTPTEASDEDTSDDTKNRVMELINPKTLGIKIKRIVRTKNKAVRIESETSNIEEKLKSCAALLENKFEVKTPTRTLPRLAVYSVKAKMEEKDLKECIKAQNDLEEGCHVRPLFRFGKRNENVTNWVVEVDPLSRKKILNTKRVYIEFSSFKVKDFVSITRCFKCQRHGHTSKNCKEKEYCEHCSENHDTRHCDSRDQPACCINCKRAKMEEHNHSAADKKCPCNKRQIDRIIENIDYGE
jgi:hypothetical protein